MSDDCLQLKGWYNNEAFFNYQLSAIHQKEKRKECEMGEEKEQKKEIVVEIWKRGLLTDSGIRFLCESARLVYENREVIMYEIKQVGNIQGGNLLLDLFREDNKFVVKLLPNVRYTVRIGKDEHILLPTKQ